MKLHELAPNEGGYQEKDTCWAVAMAPAKAKQVAAEQKARTLVLVPAVNCIARAVICRSFADCRLCVVKASPRSIGLSTMKSMSQC